MKEKVLTLNISFRQLFGCYCCHTLQSLMLLCVPRSIAFARIPFDIRAVCQSTKTIDSKGKRKSSLLFNCSAARLACTCNLAFLLLLFLLLLSFAIPAAYKMTTEMNCLIFQVFRLKRALTEQLFQRSQSIVFW